MPAAYAEVLATTTSEGHGAYNYSSACFNSMLAPVFPFALRGVLWNQGEHNSGDRFYADKLTALIADWRAARAIRNCRSLSPNSATGLRRSRVNVFR